MGHQNRCTVLRVLLRSLSVREPPQMQWNQRQVHRSDTLLSPQTHMLACLNLLTY